MTERLWFKIGEASALVGASPKELRYWERVIPDLKPRRSKGNLRYYHQDELAKLQRIRQWLSEGFTVADCRELLRGSPVLPPAASRTEPPIADRPRDYTAVLSALRSLRERLRHPVGAPQPASALAPRLKIETPKAETPARKPTPKTKPEPSALGRMWSQVRLPLDWDE